MILISFLPKRRALLRFQALHLLLTQTESFALLLLLGAKGPDLIVLYLAENPSYTPSILPRLGSNEELCSPSLILTAILLNYHH